MKESCGQNVENVAIMVSFTICMHISEARKAEKKEKQTQTRKGEMNKRKINFVRL